MRLDGAHADVLSLLQQSHDRVLAASSDMDPVVTASTLFDVGHVSSALQASSCP